MSFFSNFNDTIVFLFGHTENSPQILQKYFETHYEDNSCKIFNLDTAVNEITDYFKNEFSSKEREENSTTPSTPSTKLKIMVEEKMMEYDENIWLRIMANKIGKEMKTNPDVKFFIVNVENPSIYLNPDIINSILENEFGYYIQSIKFYLTKNDNRSSKEVKYIDNDFIFIENSKDEIFKNILLDHVRDILTKNAIETL